MFKVTKKPLTPNMIWDSENNRPLCKFDKKGILETNDETLAEKLKALGHTVTGAADKQDEESDNKYSEDTTEENTENVQEENTEKAAGTTNTKKSTASGKSGRK